jgi:hypothetical protein
MFPLVVVKKIEAVRTRLLANRRIRPLCHLSGVRNYSLPREITQFRAREKPRDYFDRILGCTAA